MTKINKEGWEVKKLGEVCTILNGYAFKSDKYVASGVRILRITNVQKGFIVDNDPKFYSEENFTALHSYELFEDDILMSLTGNVGRVGVLQASMLPAALNQRVACLRIKEKELNDRFIFHLLNSDKFEQEAIDSARGIAQKNMSTEWLKNYPIPLPPLPLQHRIVEELDEINTIISAKKQQLKELDELAQSIFYNMFGDPVSNEMGWEVDSLGNASICITDGDHMPPPKSEEGIPFVTIGNINKDGRFIDFSSTYHVPQDYYDGIAETRKPKEGDVLYTVTGSYGIPILVKDKVEFCFQRHIGLIRPKDVLVPVFLCYWALNGSVKHLADQAATGIAQKTVSLKSIRNFKIILPPLPLQETFAARVSAIEEEKAAITASIEEMQTLLDARMQEYFG